MSYDFTYGSNLLSVLVLLVREKNVEKTNKKYADVVLPVSLKVSQSISCPMFNVSNVVPKFRRINRYTAKTN